MLVSEASRKIAIFELFVCSRRVLKAISGHNGRSQRAEKITCLISFVLYLQPMTKMLQPMRHQKWWRAKRAEKIAIFKQFVCSTRVLKAISGSYNTRQQCVFDIIYLHLQPMRLIKCWRAKRAEKIAIFEPFSCSRRVLKAMSGIYFSKNPQKFYPTHGRKPNSMVAILRMVAC